MIARAGTYTLPFWLFAFGFFTCTWDILLTHDLAGFTLKLYQPLFLLALGAQFWEQRNQGLVAFVQPLSRPFAASMLLLAGFFMGMAPWSSFPLKSFLYSGWLIFDITVIWLCAQHLARKLPGQDFLRLAWFTLVILSAVVLIDQVAYQFGYTSGLLGGNQDATLKWGVSRPHAFSGEPSYLAAFLSLGLITTASQIFQSTKRKKLFVACFLIILFSLIATTSRTGWLSLGLGFAGLMMLPLLLGRKVQWRPFAIILGLIIAISTIFYFTMPENQRNRMSGLLVTSFIEGKEWTGYARLRAFITAGKMAQETNYIGTGLGASYRYYRDHGGLDQHNTDEFSVKNYGNEVIMSFWGQLLAEGGLIGLFLFGLAGFFLVRDLLRSVKLDSTNFALGALTATLVCFGFVAFFLGNICRGDVWVWYALWSAVALPRVQRSA